ncbi:MAG: peptidase M16 [Leptolyngbya foveolarum]|uniref:Peptidase M16 n=1 Tax=Leptolyngbya foveolarum TaxID=47253 RepID=A0A2W4W1B6_9CYAN|nr:MAG: peptidase M16 [Leptolyngbya foveolarum]
MFAPSTPSEADLSAQFNRVIQASEPFASPLSSPVVRRLPHGLTIIAEQMPADAVNLGLWLNVGSRVESDAINGMAHFLEHMIFKGTPQINQGEFERQVEARGAVMNAATSQDYTHFYITTAPQDFAALAPLQVELVINPTLGDIHFEREKPVILEEIRRAEDSPARRAFYRSMKMGFDTLPYRRPVLGPTRVVESLSAAQMRAFHHTWYQPQNMTAVVVGNLPVEEMIATVVDSFEQALAKSDRQHANPDLIAQAPSTQPEAPFPTIYRQTHTDEALQQARLIISWRAPGMCNLEQTYPLDVAAYVLGQGRTARLVDDLLEQQHLVSDISVRNMTYGNQGLFYISATIATASSIEAGLAATETAILAHIARLHETPIDPNELNRVKTQVANRYVFASETPSDRAGIYGYHQAITGDVRHALNYPESIRQVSAEDVRSAVRKYLPLDAYGVVSLKPAAEA